MNVTEPWPGIRRPSDCGCDREVLYSWWQCVVCDQYRLAEHVKPGMTLVDVGACFGHVSIRAAALGAKVIAVEPNAVLVEFIREETRGLLVLVVNVAASDVDGEAMLLGPPEFASMCRLSPEGTEPVRTVRLDSLYGDQCIDVVKVDVEGHEAQVLRGAAGIMQTQHPLVLVASYHRDNDPRELAALIRSIEPAYEVREWRVEQEGCERHLEARVSG